jgi:ribonuclease Y
MEPLILIPLVGIAGLAIGFLVAKYQRGKGLSRQQEELDQKSNLILEEAKSKAESLKKEKALQAKEHFLKLKEEFETEANRKKNQIINNERKLKQREQNQSKAQEL